MECQEIWEESTTIEFQHTQALDWMSVSPLSFQSSEVIESSISIKKWNEYFLLNSIIIIMSASL